jgi:hypothetical protein
MIVFKKKKSNKYSNNGNPISLFAIKKSGVNTTVAIVIDKLQRLEGTQNNKILKPPKVVSAT